MPIQIDSPQDGATVTAPFPVTISYNVSASCQLDCTIEGVTQSKQVSGQGTWTTSDFNPSLGQQFIDAASSVGDLKTIRVDVT